MIPSGNHCGHALGPWYAIEKNPLGKDEITVALLKRARQLPKHWLKKTTGISSKEPRQLDPVILEDLQVEIRNHSKTVVDSISGNPREREQGQGPWEAFNVNCMSCGGSSQHEGERVTGRYTFSVTLMRKLMHERQRVPEEKRRTGWMKEEDTLPRTPHISHICVVACTLHTPACTHAHSAGCSLTLNLCSLGKEVVSSPY